MSWPVQPPPSPSAVPGADKSGKPKYFDVVIIMILVLVGYEALTGLLALLALGSTGGGSSPFGPKMAALPPEMQKFQVRIREASLPVVAAVLGVVRAVVCAYVLRAGIRTYRRTAGAWVAFGRGAIGLGVMEVASVLFALVIQLRLWNAWNEFVKEWTTAGTPMPARMESFMEGAMVVGVMVGIASVLIWGAIKVGALFYARYFVSKPEIRQYVDGR